ncbi:MAG: SDR family NAD(P)-dependent oxidoreductase [Patescibacteria group bacterium]|nr:SDR family NAD(P)-dependent oxidoreductase [Patescibacteria group bacterium]
MDLEINGKIALVTGGSRGIGAATARVLAQEGADVVVAYHRNGAGAEAVAEDVRRSGRQAWTLGMDVADSAAVQDGLDWLGRDLGRLDILVLCSGRSTVTPFDSLTPEEWAEIVAVNLNGPFHVLHAARPWLAEGSSVVSVASVAAQTGVPHHAHYAAAKAGLVNLTKSAARALAPRTRVNCVAPGMTLTEMGRQTATALPPDYAKTALLTHRYAEPEEIARLIAFVASPLAGFMTGATIDINGGRLLR